MAEEDDMRAPPDWLTIDYLSEALRTGLDQPHLTIEECDIKPAVSIGENYGNLMLRATLVILATPDSEPEVISVVCKIHNKGIMAEISKNTFQFEKEAFVIKSILPEIYEILREVTPEQPPLGPKGYFFGTEPDELAIFEDLKVSGFENFDRITGLDLEASILVLTSLAQLHAGSLALFEKNPEYTTNLSYNFWKDNASEHMAAILEGGVSALIAEASEWEEVPQDWIDRLKNLLENSPYDRELESQKFDENSINVLCHGDCWSNNFMFKKEDGGELEMRFVDFNLSSINSWVLDINYFMSLCPQKEVRASHTDTLLDAYYTTFMATVDKLGVQLPLSDVTFDTFKEELKLRAFHGFYAAIVVYPVVIQNSEEVEAEGNDVVFDQGDAKRLMYRNPTFRDMFSVMMPYLIELEVL